MSESFNLVEKHWIPVLYVDGRYQRVGIRAALDEAGQIRQIAASNPMDTFAVCRFLLTLLYWKASHVGGVDRLRDLILKSGVPTTIVNAVDREASRFGLFDPKQPFLQDAAARDEKPKSAGSPFAEMACGTNLAHFHHGDDVALRLCLPCASLGLLRLVPWTQSGGAGLSPAVHNAPPIMVLACGRSLAETLGLNLVALDAEPGTVCWSGCFAPTDTGKPIPYLEALTWNPRRVLLPEPDQNGVCWRCGSRGVATVGPIVYAKNPNTKQNKNGNKTVPFQWQDPAAFYPGDSPYTTVKSYNESLAASRRDLVSLLQDEVQLPLVARRNAHHHDWLLIIPCTDPANNKSYDHRQVRTASLQPDALRMLFPQAPAPARHTKRDGWTEPAGITGRQGCSAFVGAAIRLLRADDWAVLASAADREMHESPAAFDLLSGLLWGLRRNVAGLPSRNVAWLMLKLMAVMPSGSRPRVHHGGFCPLRMLPKRQLDELRDGRACPSPYPVSLPRGHRLEDALRSELERHLRKRADRPVDWAGLCCRLNELLR